MVIMLREVMFKDVQVDDEFIFQGETHTKKTDMVAVDYQGIKKIFVKDKEVFMIERKVQDDKV